MGFRGCAILKTDAFGSYCGFHRCKEPNCWNCPCWSTATLKTAAVGRWLLLWRFNPKCLYCTANPGFVNKSLTSCGCPLINQPRFDSGRLTFYMMSWHIAAAIITGHWPSYLSTPDAESHNEPRNLRPQHEHRQSGLSHAGRHTRQVCHVQLLWDVG